MLHKALCSQAVHFFKKLFADVCCLVMSFVSWERVSQWPAVWHLLTVAKAIVRTGVGIATTVLVVLIVHVSNTSDTST